MTTKINPARFAKGFVVFLASLLIGFTSYGQAPTVDVIIENCSFTSNTLNFDVYINYSSVGSGSSDTLDYVQAGIDFNYAGIANGGTLSVAYVASSSQLDANQQPIESILLNATSHEIRLTAVNVEFEYQGTALTLGTPIRVGTFQLSNTTVWPNNTTPSFVFYTGSSTGTKTQTKTALFATGGASTIVTTGSLTVSCNPTLNPCVTPSAPIVGIITQPTCATSTGSAALSGLPTSGTWTVTPSNGGATVTGTGATGSAPGLTASTSYTFTSSIGCVTGGPLTSPSSSSTTIHAAKVVPSAPSPGTVTQPTCTTPTGSVPLTGMPSTQAWTATASPGGATTTGSIGTTTGTISGLAPATTYTITVSNTDACTSVASSNVVVNSIPGAPAAPTVGTITQPSCGTSTASIPLSGLPSVGNWTVNSNTGGYSESGGSGTTTTTFPAVTASTTYTFTVTDFNGCTSLPSSNAVVTGTLMTPTAPVVGTVGQPICGTPTGTAALSGLPGAGAWTVHPSSGSTTNGTGTTKTITLLAASNTYTFTVTNSDGCTSPASSGSAVIGAALITPSVPTVGTITQPTCGTSTATVPLSGLPSTESWTVNSNTGGYSQSGGSGTTTASFPAVAAGITYTFTVTNTDGCTATSGNAVVNAAKVTPGIPSVDSVIQPTCSVGSGSAELSGLPSSQNWTVNSVAGGFSQTGGSGTTTGTVSGLTAGTTFTFTVTNTDGCTSAASGNAVVNAATGGAPNVPTVSTAAQPTCSSNTGTDTLSGLPSGSWTINLSDATTRTGSGAKYAVTGLTASTTYNFTVTGSNGCTSGTTSNVVINAAKVVPSTPTIGSPITPPNCTTSTGSVIINTLPTSGAWTVTASSGGGTKTGTGGGTTTMTLPGGVTYTFIVSNTDCPSDASTGAIVPAQPTPATTPTDSIEQPTCSVQQGAVAFKGLPSSGSWTLAANNGGGSYSSTGATYTFPTLNPGTTYIITLTNSSGCTASTGSLVIDTIPGSLTKPVAGTITSPTCSNPTGSVSLSSLPSSGTWTLTPSPLGTLTPYVGTGNTYVFPGLTDSTNYTFIVANDMCSSNPSSPATFIPAIPGKPTTPGASLTSTLPSCTSSVGSVAFSSMPASGTWTVTASPGGATATGTGVSKTIAGYTGGVTYTFAVTNSLGCTSNNSAGLSMPAQPTPAGALTLGVTTQPTCAQDSGTQVLTALPSSGAWTVSSVTNTYSQTGSGTSATLINIAPGTYTFHVTNSAGCTSSYTAAKVFTMAANPTIPTPSLITQPSCSKTTGAITFNAINGVNYCIDSVGAVDAYQSSVSFPIVYPQTYTLKVQKTTDPTCVSIAASTVTISAANITFPGAPTIVVTDTASCSSPTGTIAVTNYNSSLEYFLDGHTSVLDSSGVFTKVASGVHYAQGYSKDSIGCNSTVSNSVTIASVPGAPVLTFTGVSTSVCSGTQLHIPFNSSIASTSITYSVVISNLTGGTVTGVAAGSATTGSIPTVYTITQTPVNTGSTTVTLTYTIHATKGSCGNTYTEVIYVYPKATGVSVPATQVLCNGTRFSTPFQLEGAFSGINFVWSRNTPAGISGTIDTCSARDGSCGTVISDSLINSSSANVVVTYTITPYANGCSGTNFTATATVRPVSTILYPIGSLAVCTGGRTAITFQTAPTGSTTYNIAPSYTSGGPVTNQTFANGVTSIAQTLYNYGDSTAALNYTVTPFYFGCQGTSYVVTDSIRPFVTATITPTTQTIGENGTTSIHLTPLLVAGTAFNWTISSNGFITGASQCLAGCVDSISQTLHSTATTNQNIYYYVTPTANGCSGTRVNVLVTVRGTPQATGGGLDVSACSNQKKTINLTATISGTTWAWVPTVFISPSDGTLSGYTMGTGSPISQTLTNTGSTAGQIYYTITPTYFGVNGSPIVDTITIQPLPKANVTPSPATVCSGTALDIVLGTGFVPNTTYSWTPGINASISGATACSANCTAIKDVLTTANLVSKQNYSIIPYANGCAGTATAEVVYVEIDYTNTPTVTGQTYGICPGVAYYYDVSNTQPYYTVSWQLPTGCTTVNGTTLTSNPVAVQFPSWYVPGYVPTESIKASMSSICGGYVSPQGSIKPTPTGGFAVAGNKTGLCGGQSQTFSVANFSNLSYTWSTNDATDITLVSYNTNVLTADFSSSFVSGTITCNISGCGSGPSQNFSLALTGKPNITYPVPSGGIGSGCTKAITAVGYNAVAPIWSWTAIGPGHDSIPNMQTTYIIGGTSTTALTVQATNSCGVGTYSNNIQWNGSSCREESTGIESQAASSNVNTLRAYPNPAHDKLNVVFNSSANSNYVVRLIDITGRTVLNRVNSAQEGTNMFEIDLSNYARGVYSLSVTTDSGSKQIRLTVE